MFNSHWRLHARYKINMSIHGDVHIHAYIYNQISVTSVVVCCGDSHIPHVMQTVRVCFTQALGSLRLKSQISVQCNGRLEWWCSIFMPGCDGVLLVRCEASWHQVMNEALLTYPSFIVCSRAVSHQQMGQQGLTQCHKSTAVYKQIRYMK
jgi:hypothetical protein